MVLLGRRETAETEAVTQLPRLVRDTLRPVQGVPEVTHRIDAVGAAAGRAVAEVQAGTAYRAPCHKSRTCDSE